MDNQIAQHSVADVHSSCHYRQINSVSAALRSLNQSSVSQTVGHAPIGAVITQRGIVKTEKQLSSLGREYATAPPSASHKQERARIRALTNGLDRTSHYRGIKIDRDVRRNHRNFNHCSGTELTPAPIFECPAILAAIQEIGVQFSSTNLYVDNIEHRLLKQSSGSMVLSDLVTSWT
ncbi:hypothetical protein TNCV_1942941 [Trichonephila clavipes]|nr:hypothetical protein TNCV_1942941 [Trichonephila clavipes]